MQAPVMNGVNVETRHQAGLGALEDGKGQIGSVIDNNLDERAVAGLRGWLDDGGRTAGSSGGIGRMEVRGGEPKRRKVRNRKIEIGDQFAGVNSGQELDAGNRAYFRKGADVETDEKFLDRLLNSQITHSGREAARKRIRVQILRVTSQIPIPGKAAKDGCESVLY